MRNELKNHDILNLTVNGEGSSALLKPNSAQEQTRDQEEARQYILSALDALSAHVAILDDTGEIIGVNAAWREFAIENDFNLPDYGIGTNYLTVCENSAKLNSPDASLVADGIRAIMDGSMDEFQLEYPCHSPYEHRWFVLRISGFHWYEQRRLIVAHQNVSELKRAQLELAESKQKTEAILDNVNNAIISSDFHGIIETANRSASRIFGYELHELIGKPLEELIITEADFRNLNGDLRHELVGRRKDGTRFPIEFSLNELQLNDGIHYTCIIQNISLRKRMENEVRERERVQMALEKERDLRSFKNRFLSMMGHELNTPLASISLSYDMLKKYRHLSTEDENEQALDNIQQQVGHLTEIVKDVMTLSRAEAEGLSIEPKEIDLITYCRDVVEEFQFSYHKSHQLEFECESRDIRAQIDSRMMRRVFSNLLSNAIKYSPKGGKISFELRQEDKIAIIRVSDSGIGIPEKELKQLFEPFQRASNAAGFAGTGLGLAIVKQVVELHQGSVEVESKLGKGACFSIRIPLKQS
jgi:PAS domain S-box-containing protein